MILPSLQFFSTFMCLSFPTSPLVPVTVNMSCITKTSRALLSLLVHNGTDNLTTEMLLGEMGLHNSIVTALYWKQVSWEVLSITLCLSSFQPLTRLSHSLSRSSSFLHFPSSCLSLLISSKTSQIPKSCPTQA